MSSAGLRLVAITLVVALVMGAWWMLASDEPTPRASSEHAAEEVAPPSGLPTGDDEPDMVLPEVLPEAMSERVEAPLAVDDATQEPVPQEIAVERATLTVLHSTNRVANGVRVASVSDGQLLDVGDVDSEGMVTLADSGEGGSYLVAGASDHVLTLEPQDGDRPGEFTLQVGERHEIEGWVTIDGQRPRQPIDLALAARAPGPRHPLQRQLRRADAQLRGPFDDRAQRVGAAGWFRFSGLINGWSGRVHVPPTYQFATGYTFADVSAPGSGVHLELVTRPRLTGRVILIDGTPVVGATVQAKATYSQPSGTTTDGALSASFITRTVGEMTDDEGRFAIPVPWPQETPGSLLISSKEPHGELARAFEGWVGTAAQHLGDLVLITQRRVDLRVVDLAGTPIAGARAKVPRLTVFGAPPTDAEGLTTIHVGHGVPVIQVHALRYQTADVPLPAEVGEIGAVPEAPLDVVLEGCPTLRVSFVVPEGQEIPEGLVFELAAEERLFSGEQDDFGMGAHRADLGAPGASMIETTTWQSPPRIAGIASYPVVAPELEFSCLEAGVLFSVTLADAGFNALWTRENMLLNPGELRELEVPVPVPVEPR